jgi:hypothetical protein
MDAGFARVAGDIRELRGEMKAGFAWIDQKFATVDEKFNRLDEKFDRNFDRLTWALLVAAVGLIGILIRALLAHAL